MSRPQLITRPQHADTAVVPADSWVRSETTYFWILWQFCALFRVSYLLVILAIVLATTSSRKLTGQENPAGNLMSPGIAADVSTEASPMEDEAGAPTLPAVFQPLPGGFLSVVKIVFLIVIFILWVATADWVSRDCDSLKMPFMVWNMIFVFLFLLAMLLVMVIPVFFVGFPIVCLAYGIPLLIFVLQRNRRVHEDDRVFTPNHIKKMISAKQKKQNSGKDESVPQDKGPPIGLVAMGADSDLVNKANRYTARQSPGFLTVREVLHDALDRYADKIMLDYTSEGVSVRMEIDGVWHDAGARDRETGDPMLAVLKKLCNLNIEDRRSRQTGCFGVSYKRVKRVWDFGSQGTKKGERAVLQMQSDQQGPQNLDELGMRPKLLENVKELMRSQEGLIVFSSLPAGGLSTTFIAALQSMDRFMRHIVSFENASRPEIDIDNIDVSAYQAVEGPSITNDLTRLIRTEPDVIIAPSIQDGKIADLLSYQAVDGKLVISTIRAKEAVEALLRFLMLKATPEEFAPAVKAVINQRLVRKLCNACKEAYQPPAAQIKQLGLPPTRVDTFYREPQSRSEDQEVCTECGGIGYRGRTAIFELLIVSNKLRENLVKQPKIEVLRKVAYESGHRSLQEEGIVLVASGVTSLPELTRVLRQ